MRSWNLKEVYPAGGGGNIVFDGSLVQKKRKLISQTV